MNIGNLIYVMNYTQEKDQDSMTSEQFEEYLVSIDGLVNGHLAKWGN